MKLTNTVIEGGQFSLGANKQSDSADNNNMEVQDILKFGLDKLFATEDSTIEDIDFDSMLGPTVKGEWQPVEQTNAETTSKVTTSENKPGGSDTKSMYMFEGKDYSAEPSAADQKVFDDMLTAERIILEEEDEQGPALRKTKTARVLTMMPDFVKERRKLTPEELEARKKKRAETMERKAKEEEEERERRGQENKKRREKLWEKNAYDSTNLPLEEDNEEEDDACLSDDDENASDKAIHYVSGDVTHPTYAGGKDAMIVHCVDDSGYWGSGGLFSAISRRTLVVEESYSLSGKMKDLELGDCHLIPVDDLQGRNAGGDFVSLVVAQHRDRKNRLSGIKLEHLSTGLQRLYTAAKKEKASVHLPRIGHSTPGFNWYGTERLIRKHLASKGIPTYIYYYARKRPAAKRRRSSSKDLEAAAPKVQKQNSPQANTSLNNTSLHGKYDMSDSGSDTEDYTKGATSSATRDKTPWVDDRVPSHDTRAATPDISTRETDEGISPQKMYETMRDVDEEPSDSFLDGISIYLHNLPTEQMKKFRKDIIAHDGDIQGTIEESTDYVLLDPDITSQDLREMQEKVADFLDPIPMVSCRWLEESCTARKKLDVANYLLK